MAGIAALALAGAGVFVACAPMSLAAPGAVSSVERVVGESGVVSARTVERGINVTPVCTIRVRLHDSVPPAETARILEDVWAAPGDSPCSVSAVELASRSSILGHPAEPMDPAAAAAVSAALHRFDLVTLGVADDGGIGADASVRTGDFATAADLVEDAAASQDLEEAFGRVRWALRWSGEGPPYDDATITADATPATSLAALLRRLGALRESGALGRPAADTGAALDAPISGVSVEARTESGVTSVGVDLTVAGWSADDLTDQRDALVSASRAATAAARIAAIGQDTGVTVGPITASQSVELVPAP